MKKISFERVVVAYTFIALITFGHAYETRPDTYDWVGHTVHASDTGKMIDALAISAFWPLYLSTHAWKGRT